MPPPIEDLSIRPVGAADLDTIAALQEASILALGVPTYSAAQARAWARVGIECRHDLLDQGSFWLAERGGRAVGVGGWSPDSQDPSLAWLRYLFVHPDVIGRGIGRRLVEIAERAALTAGRRRVQVWSGLNAVGFYEAQGYRRLRTGRWPVAAGIEMDFVLLGKKLTPPSER
jgi:GNAT superfamily N-acetyltransferase